MIDWIISTSFLLLTVVNSYPRLSNKELWDRFYCREHRDCTHSGNKVCGFDEDASFLAEFDDLCTMHKINCRGDKGKFKQVKNIVCEMKISYMAEHPDETFEWEHVNHTAKETIKTASKGTASKDIASKDTASKDTASKDTASKDTASKDTAPKDTAPKDTAPKDTYWDGTRTKEDTAKPPPFIGDQTFVSV